MNNPLFIIDNLTCAYRDEEEVLKIEQLSIPRHKFIVLVGISGSGKSTFLETLGLMNNTIKAGDIRFYPEEDSDPWSMKSLWSPQKRSEISRVRKKYFSFIFQNTNLMQNFTAYENACLSQMIQGKTLPEAMENVKAQMEVMGLSDVREGKNAVELSGGQKQRLAFVRAITSDFTVLFGDEPTGNLDQFNSDELMSKLSQNIKKHKRTAIIVSHNIELSVKYADMLIVLHNNALAYECTRIEKGNIFTRSSDDSLWYDHNNKQVPNIVEIITNQLIEDSKQKLVNPA